MTLFLKLAASAIISALLLVGGIFTGKKLSPQVASSQVSFGSFSPVQGSTYSLQGAGVTATQNTIPLTSFTTPDGRAITMSMFGSIGYGTLEPNTNSKIEDITFTGVTQNPNGTAVLTGVTRGNDFVTPYVASTTLAKAHAGGSYFILSNTAGFYGQQFLFANNTSTSSATLVFSSTTPPRYDADPIWGNFTTEALASIAYVNSVVAAGAANASESVKGIVQLATAAQAALGTSLGSTGARLALGNNLATSTPYNSGTNVVPVTGTNEKLSQSFWDLTVQYIFSGGILNTASSTNTATTSIAASNVLSNALVLHGIPYAFPSSQGGANTFAKNDGLGNISWETPTVLHYTVVNSNSITANGSGVNYATSTVPLTIPAGTLTASSTWVLSANATCTTSTSDCIYLLRDSGGTTFATCDLGNNSQSNNIGFINMQGSNQSSLSSQSTLVQGWVSSGAGASNSTFRCQAISTAAFNTANAINLVMVAEQTTSSQNTTISGYSLTVNP